MAESDKIVSIITCDTEGRIETFNEHAEKIFGYSADEVMNLPVMVNTIIVICVQCLVYE